MRLDIYLHYDNSQDKQLENIERLLRAVLVKENTLMALGQDILDAVTAETTAVDSFIALVQGLVANNTIDSVTGQKIMDAVNSNKAKLDAAITANTPPAPPTA